MRFWLLKVGNLLLKVIGAALFVAVEVQGQTPAPCGPVPTDNQLRWQEMEMYAFIHYSLNTYTDQEWGFGNEDPQLFNPSNLHFFFSSPKQMMIDWDTEQTFTTFRYLPPQASKEGTVTHYTLWAKIFRFDADRLAEGERMAFDDFDICANNQ